MIYLTRGHRISLIGVDNGKSFRKSQEAVKSLIKSFDVSQPLLRRSSVKSYLPKNADEATDAVFVPTDLMHVMSHANSTGTVVSHNITRLRWYFTERIPGYIEETWEWPSVDCVLLDACHTWSPQWRSIIRDCLQPEDSVIYIGTTDKVDWQEATTFTTLFYLALLGSERSSEPEVRKAVYLQCYAEAKELYRQLRGSVAPFRAAELTSARHWAND
jgi:hypothetical protein